MYIILINFYLKTILTVLDLKHFYFFQIINILFNLPFNYCYFINKIYMVKLIFIPLYLHSKIINY